MAVTEGFGLGFQDSVHTVGVSMLDWRMIFFENVDEARAGIGEAHSIGGGIFGKARALAAGIAGIAKGALFGFGRLKRSCGRFNKRPAFALPGFKERKARGKLPGAGAERAEREEVRAGHELSKEAPKLC